MFTKMRTFQIDLKGKIRESEERTHVELLPFWEERVKGGAELAVVQTPVIPTDDELENELLVASKQEDLVTELVTEIEGLQENHFNWTPDPQNPIDAYLNCLFSLNDQMLIKDRIELIKRAITASVKVRRNVNRTIERFAWDGKRYACHLKTISDTQHVAEVDMGIPMLQIDLKGKLSQQMDPSRPDRPARGPLTTRTLLGRLFPGIHIVQITVPSRLNDEQKTIIRNALYSVVYKGLRYKPTLATGGLKNGQIILIEEKYAKPVAKMYHQIPQAALGYGGIVVNECSKALASFVATIKVVKEGEYGTNDSRGFIDQSSFEMLKTLDAGHFYQFRMAFLATEGTLVKEMSNYDHASLKRLTDNPVPTKGVFKVMDNATASHPEIKANFVIPDSCLKPSRPDLIGKTFRCVVHVGITEQSYDGITYGGPTVATHIPWDILSDEVYGDSVKMMLDIAQGFDTEGHAELLHKIGSVNKTSDSELMRVMEACLVADGNGGMMRHPYIHSGAKKLLAKWMRKLLSGGIELNIRALADDGFSVVDSNGVLHCGSDWMPENAALTDYEGKRSICIRFPVRMREDLLPVRHISRKVASRLLKMKFPHMPADVIEHVINQQLYLKHVHVLNGKFAKVFGGDFDFDLVYVLSGVRYKKVVDWRFDYIKDERKQPTKNKKKRESLWHQFGQICFDAMSNKVGRITNDIMSAIAVGKIDLVYTLAIELQEEVSGLKHDTSADMEIVERCEKELGRPANWIEMLAKEDIRSFDDLPEWIEPVSEGDVIAHLYNKLYKQANELIGSPRPLSEYSGLFNGLYGVRAITKPDYREASLVNSFYGNQSRLAISHSAKKLEALQAFKREQKMLRGKIKDEEARAKSETDRAKADRLKSEILVLKSQNREMNETVRGLEAAYEQAQFDTKKGLSFFRNIVCAWGNGKPAEEKMYWAAVMNEVITKKASYDNKKEDGKNPNQFKPGTGSCLTHAFPQQFVDAVAGATEGTSVTVDTWRHDWSVLLDAEKLTITKVETGENGQTEETLLYQGHPSKITLHNGNTITVTDWKRRVALDFLGDELDEEEIIPAAAIAS